MVKKRKRQKKKKDDSRLKQDPKRDWGEKERVIGFTKIEVAK